MTPVLLLVALLFLLLFALDVFFRFELFLSLFHDIVSIVLYSLFCVFGFAWMLMSMP